MAFINEYISEEDRKKYNIDEIDKGYVVGATLARDWTVDKERDIYLRNVANGREDYSNLSDWTFYWSGELIKFRMEIIQTGRGEKGHKWAHKKITKIEIPESLQAERERIIQGIREALDVYKSGGVFSKAKTYDLTLDVTED